MHDVFMSKVCTPLANTIQQCRLNPYNTTYYCVNHRRFFYLKSSQNVLLKFSSFRFILLHILWVNGHYTYFTSLNAAALSST